MSYQKNFRFFLPLLLLLTLFLAGCDNSTPTPQNLPYYPGCSTPNLIGHIGQANSNPGPDVINLDPNCLYILNVVDNSLSLNNHLIHNGLPIITSEITINGNMAMIDIQRTPGEPGFGHFYVNPTGDLELYDLTLSNGLRQLGGAVIVVEGDFFASSTYFFDNGVGPMDMNEIAPGLGGAIYNESGRVRIIKNSLFNGNYASQPSVQGGDLGGAIYSKNGVLTVYSTTFESNSSADSAGAIYSEKSASDESGGLVTIDGSFFIGNTAVQDGGAIYLNNEMNGVIITNSDFLENQTDGSGGAIFSKASDLTASFGTFEDNTATMGGAIFSKRLLEGSLSSLTSIRSIYNHNIASEIGGAIFSENSDVTLEHIISLNNIANSCGVFRNGGSPSLDIVAGDLETAPHVSSITQLSDSFIHNNLALLSHGGAICHVMGDLSIRDTQINYNRAESMGGGVLLLDKSKLSGLLVMGNEAERGGGVAAGYPHDYTPGMTFFGGFKPDFNTSISNSSFIGNQAIFRGGGLWSDNDGRVIITNSTFTANTTDFTGGGLFQFAGDLYVSNSTFSRNSAAKGGGLYAFGSLTSNPILEVIHTTFAYNTASESSNGGNSSNTRWGGGALNVGGSATVKNSLFVDNLSMNCQLDNGMSFSAPGTYATDHTCASQEEANPQIGPLMYNGGATKSHALLPGSPLIDILPDCAGLVDDQRGVARPQGVNCDPGAYEFDPSNPPEEWPFEEISLEPDDSLDNCDPFEELEISLIMLNLPPDTRNLPVYLKVAEGIFPGFEVEPPLPYSAKLGEIQAYQVSQQGFPERLYFMFNIPEGMEGTAQFFELRLNDCPDPVFQQANVLIPVPKSIDPKCTADLNEADCKAAGGHMSSGVTTAPTCICP